MIARNLHFYELMYVFGGIITMKNSIQKTIQHGTEILWYLVLANTLSFDNPNIQPK